MVKVNGHFKIKLWWTKTNGLAYTRSAINPTKIEKKYLSKIHINTIVTVEKAHHGNTNTAARRKILKITRDNFDITN